MADNPFDHTNYGLREKPVSADWNQLQSQIYMTMREVHRYLHQARVSSSSSAAQSVSGFHGAGFRVVPSSPAAMSVVVSAGLGFLYLPTDIPTNLGATDLESVDDLSPYKPLLVQSPLTFNVPTAPAAPNSRIDIIEVRNPRRLENAIPRRQLDPNTLQYDDHIFNKTLAYQIDNNRVGVVTDPASSTAELSYKVGTAANPGLVPATSPNYTKIAEILVPNTATSITGAGIIDRRPLLASGGVVRASIRYELLWNGGAPTVTVIAVSAPPGLDLYVALPSSPAQAQSTVYCFGGQIQNAVATVSGCGFVGSGPVPVYVVEHEVGGIGINLVRAAVSGDFALPSTPSMATAAGVGQQVVVVPTIGYDLTAAPPSATSGNTVAIMVDVAMELTY